MIHHLISTYGVFVIAGAIALECMAIPLVPGEAVMIAAAIYAGTTHELGIVTVIVAGIVGAIVGNVAGYFLGREFGYRLLVRYGIKVGMSESRIKIARYLFRQYGARVVIVARFVTVFRSIAGILAGANQMPWPPFLMATVLGGVAWTIIYGLAAYFFGHQIRHLAGPVGAVIIVAVIAAVIYVAREIGRREEQLRVLAEEAYPGPLSEKRTPQSE
jgi:membrane protein DedA with SNARE-associated domain